MTNSYSINRPNQGSYYKTLEMHHKDADICERTGTALSQRIGHYISATYNNHSVTKPKKAGKYIITKGANRIEGYAIDLIEGVFGGCCRETFYKAVRNGKYKLQGWTIAKSVC